MASRHRKDTVTDRNESCSPQRCVPIPIGSCRGSFLSLPFIAKIVPIAAGKGKKGKVNRAPQESVGGCSSPSPRPGARRWRTTNVCDAWPLRHQTYGYLPSCKASPRRPLAGTKLYCLVTGMRVNNLPRVALDSGEARIRTRDLLIASPAS